MEKPSIGNRIIVLGCPGSGKSTFARALAARTELPLIHLDSVWWRADGSHISRDEFDRALSELLAGEKWIMDGDYSRTYEVRLRAADMSWPALNRPGPRRSCHRRFMSFCLLAWSCGFSL